MNDDELKKFLEELEDSGGDIAYWSERKERENKSFYGFEIDPKKERKLNELNKLCARLAELDDGILFTEMPLTNKNRNGSAQLSLPTLFFTGDARVMELLTKCFALSDHVTLAAPRLIDEEAEDEDFTGPRVGREVVITFGIADMWKTYGKAPFI